MPTIDLPDWNAVRYDPASSSGHVESYFLKANDPDGHRALWIKATVFASRARPSRALAEAWAVVFDRNDGHVAFKQSLPYSEAEFSHEGLGIRIGDLLRLEPGRARGAIEHAGRSVQFDLATSGDSPPIVPYPVSRMYRTPFPRLKLVSPQPDLSFDGIVKVDGRELRIDGWRGMQGHNWGSAHAEFYAWGHCNVWDQPDGPVLEVMSARLRLGPVHSPMFTLICLRHEGVSYELNSPGGWLRNRGAVDGRRWHLHGHRGGVRVEADVSGHAQDFVGLYYPNPDGRMTYCLNTELATARVRIELPGREPTDWLTRAAAFEIGTREPDHGVRMYV